MTALAGAAPAPALDLAYARTRLGDLTLGAVTVGAAAAARPVVLLLDASGSLVGPPGLAAAAFAVRLLAALEAREAAVVALGAEPALLRALGPARQEAGLPLGPTLHERVAGGRADVPRACALLLAEAARAGCGAALEVVLVSDLALGRADVQALRGLEREGARLHPVLAPSSRPPAADLAPVARVDEGPDALAAVLARVGGPGAAPGRLAVELPRPPRAWFLWRGGRLEGGAPASLAGVERSLTAGALAFVTDDPAPRGRATFERRALDLEAAAGEVAPALQAAVREALGLEP